MIPVFRDFVKENMFNYNFSGLTCPHCKSVGFFGGWGSYERNLIDIVDGKITIQIIKVQRIQCKACEHTHALLSNTIIPFKIYSARFILHVLNEVYNNRKSVGQVCFSYGISFQLFFIWKKQFSFLIVFIAPIRRVGLSIVQVALSTIITQSIFDFLKWWYDTYQSIFMHFISTNDH